MLLPKETLAGNKQFDASSGVYLAAGHICIKKAVAEQVFGNETVVLTVFYAKDNTFMAAPASEPLFKTIHKASQQMLKLKNAAGDKSIAVQEVLLDNDLSSSDRDLAFVVEDALHILKITL